MTKLRPMLSATRDSILQREIFMRLTLWLVTLVGLALMWLSPAGAAPTSNPTLLGQSGQFFVAGELDFRFEKDLDFDNAGEAEIENVLGLFARPGYWVLDNLSVYGRLGLIAAEDINAAVGLGAGVQGVYVIPQAPGWRVGGSVEFLYKFESDAETNVGDREFDFFEFQLTLAGGYQFEQLPQLSPYAGFMLDFFSGELGRTDLDQDNVFGLLFGATYEITERLKAEGQFRFVSETALFLNVLYTF